MTTLDEWAAYLRSREPTFMDTYGDPYLLDCSCGCLHSKSRLCRVGRSIRAERIAYEERRALRYALTADDLAWLAGHGWTP